MGQIIAKLLICMDVFEFKPGGTKLLSLHLWQASHRGHHRECGRHTTIETRDFRLVHERLAAVLQAHDLDGRPFPPTARISARNRPVNDSRLLATSSGVPCATMRPPPSPPSGPRSMT